MQHVRRQQSDSAVMVFVVVPGEEALAKGTCILDGSESVGELGPVFESFELTLRVWVVVGDVWPTGVLVTPRSASISATGFEVIEVPRSAWIVRVSGAMPCFSQVAAISRLANSAVSRLATIQPTTLRLKMSRMT